MVDSELIVVITDADGNTKTLDSHATVPGDRPRGIQFGTQQGSGFLTASFTLACPIDEERTDINILDDVQFVGTDGDVAYEGFVAAMPRSLDAGGEATLTVSCAGWIATAGGEPISMIFGDRDLSQWRGAAVGRIVDLLSANFMQPAAPTVVPDGTTGRAALSLQHADEWAAPIQPIAEAWYDAGPGNTISAIYWDAINAGQSDPANWDLYVRTTATDDFAIVNASSGDQWGSVPISGFLVDPNPVRYAVITFAHPATPGGGSGYVYAMQMRDVAVYGDVDLIRQTGDQPYGVTASDVIRWTAARACPLLNTAGVRDTDHAIRQLAFRERTKPYDIFLKVNSYHLWQLGVWEGRTLHFAPVDLTDWDWEIRHDVSGTAIGLQGDEYTELRSAIVVEYTDVATGRSEVLLPADHPELRDTNPDNPYNRHGWYWPGEPYVVPFPTTQADALELGRIQLLEDNQLKAPGSFTERYAVLDRAGIPQPPWKVRAGHRVRLTSTANLSDRPRLVLETAYDHSTRTVTIGVDSTLRLLNAAVDRVQTALQAAGLA